MTRRPHHYSGDIGGVAASRRRAVTDLTAVEPPGPGGDHRKPRGCGRILILPICLVLAWLGAIIFAAVS